MSVHVGFGSFSRKMRFRADELDRNVNRTVRRVALGVHQAVATETPVDIGIARSNWIVTLGSPSNDTRPAFVPGKSGSTGAANLLAAFEEARSVVGSRPSGVDVWIANNLPYIGELNAGKSAQAPAGFVQAAAAEAARVVAGARIFEAP